jgi:heme/copper-type cytochrome/quinol oxidase subunit 4
MTDASATYTSALSESTKSAASTGWLVLLGVVGVALLVLFVAAVVSIVRSRRLTSQGKIVWIIGVLIFQFFGPLAWFLVGRKNSPQLYRSSPA